MRRIPSAGNAAKLALALILAIALLPLATGCPDKSSSSGDPVITVCSDLLDNDGDTFVDLADQGCSSAADQDELGTTQCDDGVDNDGDTLSDFDDPGCDDPSDISEYGLNHCDDGVDNDGDFLADGADPGCSSVTDASEQGINQCDNGLDDDGDTFSDLIDPGCDGVADTTESGANGCDDGIDNDGDTTTDWPADTDCYDIIDRSESPFSSFKLSARTLQTAPAGAVDAPTSVAAPTYPHQGITLDFENQNYSITLQSITATATDSTATVKVKNESATTTHARVWLVVHTPDNGASIDTAAVDGYIGNSVYYYLGTMAAAQEKNVAIEYDFGGGAVDDFRGFMDIVVVHDRVVFVSVQPSMPLEIYTIDPTNPTDIFRVTQTNGTIYPSNPHWSPDGGWIAFSGALSGEENQTYLIRADGLDVPEQLTCMTEFVMPGDFRKDGKAIYVRHFDEVSDESNIFLLDIAGARADCSNTANLTPMTVAFAGSEALPILRPQGDMLLYLKRETTPVLPPSPNPDANCGFLPPGSELLVDAWNLYLLPVDASTGLASAPETFYWFNSNFKNGGYTFSPDGTKVCGQSGGCYEAQYCCAQEYYCTPAAPRTAYNRWDCTTPPAGEVCSPLGNHQFRSQKCTKAVTLPANNSDPTKTIYGLFALSLPSDLSDPALPYSFKVAPGSGLYQYFTGSTFNDYDPSWSLEFNDVLFSRFASSRIQLWYFDALSPSTTRTQLTNFEYYNYSGRYMQAP